MSGEVGDTHGQRQRQVWSIGDYSAMAGQYEGAAADLVARADLRPGMRVLDIATGTGNVAIAAARAGGQVTGIDITPEFFDEAEARALEAGLLISWDEGDAAELPYVDASFDRVLSAFGLMFVHDGAAATREVVRVLRPGGVFAFCNWAPRGPVRAVADAMAGPGGATGLAELLWGESDQVRDLFAGLDVAIEFDEGEVAWLFADAEEGVRWLEEVSGPVVAAKAALEAAGLWADSRARLVEYVSRQTRDDLDGVWITAPYLIAVGRRTGGTS
jgi:SAM-dependent methyltransferase